MSARRLSASLLAFALAWFFTGCDWCDEVDADYPAWRGVYLGAGTLQAGDASCAAEVGLATDYAWGNSCMPRAAVSVTISPEAGCIGFPEPFILGWRDEPHPTATAWSVTLDGGHPLVLTRDGDALTGSIAGLLVFTATRPAQP